MIDWDKLAAEKVCDVRWRNAYGVAAMMPHLVRHLKAQAESCDPATQEVVSSIGEILCILAGAAKDSSERATSAALSASEAARGYR
jgi:hypothetical protein